MAELPLDHLAPDPDRVQDLGVDRVLAKDRNTVVVDVQDQEIEDDHGQEIDADQDHEKEEDDQEQDLENEEEIAAVPDHEIGTYIPNTYFNKPRLTFCCIENRSFYLMRDYLRSMAFLSNDLFHF